LLDSQMFQKLMNFSYRRTPSQAFGWYLVFLLVGIITIGGAVSHLVATGAPMSFFQGSQMWLVGGQITEFPYHIILGVLLLWNRPKYVVNILRCQLGVIGDATR
jgi:hypothetical protein